MVTSPIQEPTKNYLFRTQSLQSPKKFQMISELCIRNWNQKLNSRTKDSPNTPFTKDFWSSGPGTKDRQIERYLFFFSYFFTLTKQKFTFLLFQRLKVQDQSVLRVGRFLVRSLFLVYRHPASCHAFNMAFSMCEYGKSTFLSLPLLVRTCVLIRTHSYDLTSISFLQALSPNKVILGIRASTYELEMVGNTIQSIKREEVYFKNLQDYMMRTIVCQRFMIIIFA